MLSPSYSASRGRYLDLQVLQSTLPNQRGLRPGTGAVRQSHAISGKEHGLQNQTDLGSNPGSACHSCVTLDKSFHFSGPQFLLCKLRLIRPASYGATRCFRPGPYTPMSLIWVWLLLIFIKGWGSPSLKLCPGSPLSAHFPTKTQHLLSGVNSSPAAKFPLQISPSCSPLFQARRLLLSHPPPPWNTLNL